ncbi:MAG: arginine deiminase family protein [Lentimicrobiaceae bacterium]|mgnify:CR=1 FL=1|jgi:arginine deiminase|nr:arginine deiminase family protein [Lentimicrobiaceae bacterium]MDD4596720.1 arginine deiminase family protein [Lentimicrobiaceae bacterium]MDY0024953.1 arginine deiminase family protein [Lentimicrobium sp.]HAH60242.1 arginine deiminase [Bacteroidales bacterium]
MEKVKIEVNSEVGVLEGVIIHSPGSEVENMTPNMVQKALYSDILNLSVAKAEYKQFSDVLHQVTKVYEVRDLLTVILQKQEVKNMLVRRITQHEQVPSLRERLMELDAPALTTALVEGVEITRDNLSKFLSREQFELDPLHNFFFTRDASIVSGHELLISKMASRVRDRESIIMESIFNFHPLFKCNTVNPASENLIYKDFSFEGGDFLIARDDVMLVGTGSRTTPTAIDFLIDHYKNQKKVQHIIVQELPYEPESFIHLDMVFTLLDVDKCMIYEPLLIHSSRYLTIHITINNGKVHIVEEPNILTALKKLGMDMEPVLCGGSRDVMTQEREQWHSGANFFAIAPGQVMGYGRNQYTIEEMNRHGFEIIKAKDIAAGKAVIPDGKKCVISIEGAELSRGGGGCRCMSMPFKRAAV